MPLEGAAISGYGRYCCKSPKLPGANFLAVKKSDRRPRIDVASITLPRSPTSLSSRNEVPHIFTRKSCVRPKEILITSAKRLLQQNLPEADSCSAANRMTAIPTRHPGSGSNNAARLGVSRNGTVWNIPILASASERFRGSYCRATMAMLTSGARPAGQCKR